MKKIFIFLLIALLVFSIVGCARDVEPQPQEDQETPPDETQVDEDDALYEDGTYEGVGDEWQFGNEDAIVEIQDGRIIEITLRRLDQEGEEVDYDNWTGEEIEGRVYPNLNQYRFDIATLMIEAQHYEVDAISGATVSSENWKLAVERALEKAKQQ